MLKIINDLSHRWSNNWEHLQGAGKGSQSPPVLACAEVKIPISNNSCSTLAFFFPRCTKSLSFSSSMCALGAPNLRTGTMEQKRFHRSRTFASPASFPGNPPCPSHPWPVLAGCGRCWPGCHQLAVAAPSCGVAAGWWWLGWGWVPVFQPNACFFNPAPVFLYLFLTNQLLATIREMLKLW